MPVEAKRFAWVAVCIGAIIGLVSAQQAKNDDPVIARVNGQIISASRLDKENSDFREVLAASGMTAEQVAAEVDKRQSDIILSLINEVLLIQRAKTIPGLNDEIEQAVEREVLDVAKKSGLNSSADLEAAMKKEGLDLAAVRTSLRTQYTKSAVFSREVDVNLNQNVTANEAKIYYDANRSKFPEMPAFDETKVRQAILIERRAEAREEYLKSLRSKAVITVADNYRAALAKYLN